MITGSAPLDRYSRQVLFYGIGEGGQQRIGAGSATLVGCGALGSIIASNLVRAGLGFLRIVDRDYLELSNLQRQVLFDEEDLKLAMPKAVAAVQKLARANSQVRLEAIVADFNAGNAEHLVQDADIVLDGTDNFEARYLINDVCVKLGKPWIYAAAIAGYGVLMPIIPGRTACLRCLFAEPSPPGTTPTCDTAGILAPAAGVIANLVSAEALKLLVGAEDQLRYGLTWVDVWNNTYHDTGPTRPTQTCPACQQRRFDYLDARSGTLATALCGRDAVQVRPREPRSLALEDLATRLQAAGQVYVNQYLLRFVAGRYDITVFPDARAIIKGTDSPRIARSLYARYVGM